MGNLVFLKLGGSLITDKDQEQTALIPQIDLIARQIKEFTASHPDTRLLLGHGSGSFGHYAASRYHTRSGVQTAEQWQGFTQVWYAARLLNQIVIERFASLGLPVISFPFSTAAIANDHHVVSWNTLPIQAALDHRLLPVIYGDVVLDQKIGGTIFSTEEQFAGLVPILHPDRILLAGLEEGVWEDFPGCTKLIPEITPGSYDQIAGQIFGSASVDVTGGMTAKVQDMLSLITHNPLMRAQIFSGKGPGAILAALSDEKVGTLIRADQ